MNGERRIHGRAFVDGAIKDDILVSMRGETIVDVMQIAAPPTATDRVRGLIVPGFVDMHVHGGDGADFTDGDTDANERIVNFHAKHGTTALAATTLSASRADLEKAVKAIAETATNAATGAQICGIHLEGPYINPQNAGAQDTASIRPPDIQELTTLMSEAPRLRFMMTLAPEVEGARALMEHFRGRVLFAIGHTGAMFADAVAALEWGASHFTHLFNAMTGMHHREPGVVGAALESVNATAELIADGVHVHPAVLRIACTAMPNRIALVTDAIRATGMAEGKYKLYDYDVTVADGAARLANGTLAGSVLTMAGAVQNMVELAGIPIEKVVPMATEIPARILGVADRKGKLENGYDADVVILSEKFEVERVFAGGEEG
ncbi:MAG TPA: N-acetylglucosamine-6-phosphate deacetylase [Thermoanaerobaculia bacterium]|jgi:N-acetylglucosamine-6-phosphate deacetylase|nr:N-acetylglucosamine-6-phosphate deacetylase [Thermoanaerobaculia bacterium]